MHYKIKGIPGLEGLVVEGEYRETISRGATDPVYDYICIRELINPNAVVGDRTVHFPIPERSLFICDAYLTEVDDPGIKQFSTKSPFGKLLFEGQLRRGDLIVDYVQYDNAVTVTIREEHTDKSGTKGRTVYTQNFFKKKAPVAMQAVAHAFGGDLDVDDLIFELKEIHTSLKE
jgi:hypothetical protein